MRPTGQHAAGLLGRGALVLSFAVFAVLLATEARGSEDKGPVWRSNRGTMIFQTQPFASFDSDKEFARIVRKARRNRLLKPDKDGRWTMYFMAFMKRAPGAKEVNLVWYRLGRKREQVDYTQFSVPPDGVTLTAKATLDPAVFKRGDKLEGRITRIIGGREVVYARCNLTLR